MEGENSITGENQEWHPGLRRKISFVTPAGYKNNQTHTTKPRVPCMVKISNTMWCLRAGKFVEKQSNPSWADCKIERNTERASKEGKEGFDDKKRIFLGKFQGLQQTETFQPVATLWFHTQWFLEGMACAEHNPWNSALTLALPVVLPSLFLCNQSRSWMHEDLRNTKALFLSGSSKTYSICSAGFQEIFKEKSTILTFMEFPCAACSRWSSASAII